ncbi:hypothetical protein [Magnetospirillum sp. UT-4]|uniref:hypothetical protein n=1 Tax=Magnetospirillum sp. UT-4 TaxID=2681467 RepID=UPI00137D25CD|nr:hypothetical protein [Magnetospirillum sp. UT-4]CAA7626510.1 conserved hypothetical protein [Magnetospirillum sp. UT-4]
MLRIEEIVGAMDDEFRYALAALDDATLHGLAADRSALRRLRPVGVSHAEALAMIAAILEQRARPARPARPKRKRAPRRRPAATHEPAPAQAPTPRPTPSLPGPTAPSLLAPPAASGRPIRLGPPPDEAAAISLPGPPPATPEVPAPPLPEPSRHPVRWLAAAVLLAAALAVLAG